MKKLMSIFAAALFVFALSSCGGGGVDACSCAKDTAALIEKGAKEGADLEKLEKEMTDLTKKCADAAKEDAKAFGDVSDCK